MTVEIGVTITGHVVATGTMTVEVAVTMIGEEVTTDTGVTDTGTDQEGVMTTDGVVMMTEEEVTMTDAVEVTTGMTTGEAVTEETTEVDMADLLPTMILRGDGQPRKFRKDGIFPQFVLNDQNFNSKNEPFQKPLNQQDQVHLQIFSEQRNRSILVKKKKKSRPNFLNSTLKITDPTGLKLTPLR